MTSTKTPMEAIFTYFEQTNPAPKCALIYSNLYTLLIAVVLSAQSTDQRVNEIMPELMARASTPQALLALPIESLTELIRPIGLPARKAHYLYALSQMLIERFAGQVPDNRTDLMGLLGVGRKTANVVLNVGFHQPTIPVDTHVFRVARRLGWSSGHRPEQVEADLEKQIPFPWKGRAHGWLIHHGRTFCKARRPLCAQCPLRDLCPSAKIWLEKERPIL